MTWDEVCANPYLQDLPFEIETNRWGQIVMSPPLHNDHRFAQSSIQDLLRKKMRGGHTLQETAIDTEDGTKAADVTWMSAAFLKANKGGSSFRHAPEICVEVKSPSNTTAELLEKKDLYLQGRCAGSLDQGTLGPDAFLQRRWSIRTLGVVPDVPEDRQGLKWIGLFVPKDEWVLRGLSGKLGFLLLVKATWSVSFCL